MADCDCGGNFVYERGQTICDRCGRVAEDSNLKSEITFTERSSGNATADGTVIGHDQARARSRSKFGTVRGGMPESREQTMAKGKNKATEMGTHFGYKQTEIEQATSWLNLAIAHNFTKGRRTDTVVAACLYLVARLGDKGLMLIDFSERAETNVYTLGATFLKLAHLLGVAIPNIDPSIYLARFAEKLDFGGKKTSVIKVATNLVRRMQHDWMAMGRHPAGVCAACLFIAARMHGFRRSHREIVSVVKICETTLRKRLTEFKDTPSADLNPVDFIKQNDWDKRGKELKLQPSPLPPILTQRRRRGGSADDEDKKGILDDDDDDDEDDEDDKRNQTDSIRRNNRKDVDDDDDDSENGEGQRASSSTRHRQRQQSGRAGSQAPSDDDDVNINGPMLSQYGDDMEENGILDEMSKTLENPDFQQITRELGGTPGPSDDDSTTPLAPAPAVPKSALKRKRTPTPSSTRLKKTRFEDTPSVTLSPVTTFLPPPLGVALPKAPTDFAATTPSSPTSTEEQTLPATNNNTDATITPAATSDALTAEEQNWELLDDDNEIMNAFLTDDEVSLKKRIWEEENRDWEEKQERKRIMELASGKSSQSKKPRKPRDKNAANQAPAATAAEAARQLLATKKMLSKKINYDVLESLFADVKPPAPAPTPPAL
ncbi:hypothetical protein SmJEL517_g04472 [Synchytrium microbalum]|uniref:B-related factor 1 n=1 Tax=Synchytrium microbalum TaxID=1806994 RepID=A0A507C2Z5_9FUNG|nr:uncharacterized protein SmJEL517_g04472 [Synchytrium microbalum]TPX32454.1 hypothetical protein SmJEL517_g04472 [Synchytrium microbalum]